MSEDVVALSRATTYRVLSGAGLLKRWNSSIDGVKSRGFEQPTKPHEHWHVDIKYVNFRGTFLFAMSVFDRYSRANLHHELRLSIQKFDVELTIQRALGQYPHARPWIISDNGSQFIAKDSAGVPSCPRWNMCGPR